jgi:hypothetical protein
MAVSFWQESAWNHLTTSYPALAEMDFFRFTLDVDGSMEQIAALVNSVFAADKAVGAPSS